MTSLLNQENLNDKCNKFTLQLHMSIRKRAKWPCPIILGEYIGAVLLASVGHAETRFLRIMSSTLLLLDGSKNLTSWIFATHAMIITFNNISNPKILRYQPSNQDYWSFCPNLVLDCCFYIVIRTIHL